MGVSAIVHALLRRPLAAILVVAFSVLPVSARASSSTPQIYVDGAQHLYTLDEHGGVHPVGDAPSLATSATFAGDEARGLAVFRDGLGGYVLDEHGGLHQVGDAPAIDSGAQWPAADIARGLALLPAASASNPEGYILDDMGGIHPFGGAPAVTGGPYWPNWDIARAIAVLPDSGSSPGGYVLDGWGGLHPFGSAPPVAGGGYWPNWDIARGLSLLPGATAASPAGYELDGWGGLHPFGGAPAITGFAYWKGWDIARGVVTWNRAPAGSPGGWTLDGYGGVHQFGSAQPLATSFYQAGSDMARGFASAASGGAGAKPLPPRPILHRKIEVSLSQQHLWAYNPDGTLFLQTPVTTGMAALPTDQGDFHIFARYSPYEFISPWPPWSPFWYPDAWVSWAMEFVNDGTFLHDAPWEPNWAFGPGSEYGAYASHGCVHVPNAAMQQLYGWAKVGDEVWVHP